MITLRYDDGGVSRSLDLMIDATSLPTIFKKYIPFLRQDIQKVFDAQGPGWAPLAESTMEARQANLAAVSEKIKSGQQANVGRRLAREQARAVKRLAKREGAGPGTARTVRTNLAGASYTETGAMVGARMQKLRDNAARSVARQAVIRSEYERVTMGIEGPARKEAKKLGERLGRASDRAAAKIKKYESGDLLGQIASSITYEIKGGNLDVFSRIPWAGIHNDGGTAGHGAQIKERKYLEWTPVRIAKFAEIAAETVAAPMKK